MDNYLAKHGIKRQVWLKPGGSSKPGRRSAVDIRRGQVGGAIAKVGLDRKTIGKANLDKGAIDQNDKSKQGPAPEKLGKDKEYAFYFKEGDNIDSLVEKCVEGNSEGWTCKACGVKKNVKSNLQNHIEKHIGGTSYSCPLCGNVRRTRYQIMCHISLIHDLPKKSQIVSMARQLIPNPC